MKYSLSHLTDHVLLRDLAALVAQERATTAEVLAHIAEIDARGLYLPAAHPSMYSYCVHELHLSEDAAYKRIQAARVARQFPLVFEALATGRMHLTAVGLLAPHLTPENAAELLAAAAHKTKSQIEELLARRFPRSESFALVEALPSLPRGAEGELAPAQVEASAHQLAPAQVEPRPKIEPVAPERFLVQLTIGRSTQEKLRHAQELLGHVLPSGDIARVLDRALDALIEKLEKRKFAAASRPRPSAERPSANPRHIPAHVKRAVWERDGAQCTFVSEAGRRREARTSLEFDHVQEVARGGRASVEGIRLRCRAHNQYQAECTFGATFMRHKRETGRHENQARRAVDERVRIAVKEVLPWLRALGIRGDDAQHAAAPWEAVPHASLEERVRRALSYFHPRPRAYASSARL